MYNSTGTVDSTRMPSRFDHDWSLHFWPQNPISPYFSSGAPKL